MAADSQLKQQRICYPVKSLWWLCQNSPLCQCPPSNIEKIRETCPFIIRDKVNNMKFTANSYRYNNENVNNNNSRCNNAGSGRLSKKLSLKSIPSFSSLDESTAGKPWRDCNNNQGNDRAYIRRTSSTNCLQNLQQNNILSDASREA